MGLQVSLSFDGNCREALEFYAKIFGLSMPEMVTYDNLPPDLDGELPEEARRTFV